MVEPILYSRWLHKKTKHTYIVVGFCQLEATNTPAILYVRDDDRTGVPWARDQKQFFDGRFIRIDFKEQLT